MCKSIPGAPSVSGGTVEIEPTTGLGSNQWVYIRGSNFNPGTYIRIDYCSNKNGNPALDPCVGSRSDVIVQSSVITQTLNDGTFYYSYQVAEASTPTQELTGTYLGTLSTPKVPFLCDNSTQCAIQVTTLGTGNGSSIASDSNTAIFPVTFYTASKACGSRAQKVTTESEFGIESVLTIVDQETCVSPTPVIAFNTAFDDYAALESLTAANTQIAFIDNPQNSDMKDLLAQGNYKLIPIALTANVIAFRSTVSRNQNLFPLTTLSLTPSMVAGLLTGQYTSPIDSDLVTCPGSKCPIPPCPQHTKKTHKHGPQCSLITLLNFSPGFLLPQQSNSFVRSDETGSTGVLFQWLCNAPVVPVKIHVKNTTTTFVATFTEKQNAAQILQRGFSSQTTPLLKCPTNSQFPPLPPYSYGKYAAYNDPNQQSIKMENQLQTTSHATFGTYSSMNWAEALYYGLSIAKIQNANGQFVPPTVSSLQNAVAQGDISPNGAITPKFQSAQTGVYPMTTVVYATVCGDPTTNSSAHLESQILTQILQLTGSGAQSANLPAGFAPLPATVTTQAHSDIAADIKGGGKSQKTVTTVAKSCPLSSTNSSSAGQSTNKGASTKTLKFVPSALRTTPKTTNSHQNSKTANETSKLVVATTSGAGSAIPLLLLAGLITAVFGGLLALSEDIRRRFAAVLGKSLSSAKDVQSLTRKVLIGNAASKSAKPFIRKGSRRKMNS
jgi:hypothetical protein